MTNSSKYSFQEPQPRPGRRLGLLINVLALAAILLGCDPEHKKKCEWYLVPDTDPARAGKVGEGYIPVCARNYETNKQDCRLQTTLKFAEKVYQRKFKYIDLKVKNVGIPRTIDEIEMCD